MSNYNDYYERYYNDGEKEQSANYKSTDETAATYRDDGKPVKVVGSERLRVCRHCGTIHKKNYTECENCHNTLSSPMTPDEAEDLSDKILAEKGIRTRVLSKKNEKRLRTFCMVYSTVALLLSGVAFVLSRLIESDTTAVLASPVITTILLVANAVAMPIVFLVSVLPEPEFNFRRRFAESGSSSGAMLALLIFPTLSVICSITSLVLQVNEVFHLF